jgi:hypothetical protein
MKRRFMECTVTVLDLIYANMKTVSARFLAKAFRGGTTCSIT